jgi:hypothetical protein
MQASGSSPKPPNRVLLLCWICNKQLKIEEANTDQDGKPVHEQCIAQKLLYGDYRAG